MPQSQVKPIQWREWNEEAFSLAEKEGKPILLTLTATWCHWCHVMDQTSYSHPQVIALINSRFIPVRVDVDRRPDISYRYNQGGFPSVAFLKANSELITGRVYTPPAEMVQLLEQVCAQYPEVKAGGVLLSEKSPQPPLGQGGISAQPARPSPEGNKGSPTGLVLHRLQQIYDPGFGGFGLEPKQPPWESLKLLLALYSRSPLEATRRSPLLKMASTTLEGIRSGLYDQNDQGFFRYSVARDWKVPHYEKMLSTNANLSSVYLEAYQVTGRKRYKDIAVGTCTYLLGTLYDERRGLFYASQDAGEEYYRLPWKDREKTPKPPIDHTFYTGLNAVAASSLIKAYRVLGRRFYLEAASRVLDVLWDEGWEPGLGLRHTIDEFPSTPLTKGGQRSVSEKETPSSPPFVRGGWGEFPRFLADQVFTAQAFLDLYQAAGNVGATGRPSLYSAIQLVQCITGHFIAPDGGFYDIAASPPASPPPLHSYGEGVGGRGMLQREKPVLENSLLAEVLVRLHYLTGDGQYLDLAKETLETCSSVVPGSSYLGPKGSRRMEEDEERLFLPAGSAWGRAWDMLAAGPVHLVLVGTPSHPRTRSLWRAALRTYAPHQILQPLDPQGDADRIASLGFPTGGEPALYACMGGMCLAPITTPEEVRALKVGRFSFG